MSIISDLYVVGSCISKNADPTSIKLEHLVDPRFLVLPSLQIQSSSPNHEHKLSIIEPHLCRYEFMCIDVSDINIVGTYRPEYSTYYLNNQYHVDTLLCKEGNIQFLINNTTEQLFLETRMPKGVALIEKTLLELHEKVQNECELFIIDNDNVPSNSPNINDFGYYVLKIIDDADYHVCLNIVNQVDISKTKEHERLTNYLYEQFEQGLKGLSKKMIPIGVARIITNYCTLV